MKFHSNASADEVNFRNHLDESILFSFEEL